MSEYNKCPKCYNYIDEFDIDKTKIHRVRGELGIDENGDPLPFWSDDPVFTPLGLSGDDYKGITIPKSIHITELQGYYTELEETILSEENRTEFLIVDSKNILKHINIEQLRISIENLLFEQSLTLEDYFKYDRQGNEIETTQTDWTDVNRINKVDLPVKGEEGYLDYGYIAGDTVPLLPTPVLIRAIHIEELRIGIQIAIFWIEHWKTSKQKTYNFVKLEEYGFYGNIASEINGDMHNWLPIVNAATSGHWYPHPYPAPGTLPTLSESHIKILNPHILQLYGKCSSVTDSQNYIKSYVYEPYAQTRMPSYCHIRQLIQSYPSFEFETLNTYFRVSQSFIYNITRPEVYEFNEAGELIKDNHATYTASILLTFRFLKKHPTLPPPYTIIQYKLLEFQCIDDNLQIIRSIWDRASGTGNLGNKEWEAYNTEHHSILTRDFSLNLDESLLTIFQNEWAEDYNNSVQISLYNIRMGLRVRSEALNSSSVSEVTWNIDKLEFNPVKL